MKKIRYTFKLIIAGDGGVGKTTLVDRYVSGSFHDNSRITLGVQFMVKRLNIDGNPIDLQIWDFGGEDRFRFILPAYCRGAHGAIFMYDITNPASLYHIDGWLMVLRSQNGRFPVIMAGTKDDLGFARKVEIREAMAVAGKYGIAEAIEVSSKTGHNVELLFEEVCHQMITQLTASHIKPAVNTPQTSVIPAAGNEIVITNHQSIPSGASTAGVVAVCPPIQATPHVKPAVNTPQTSVIPAAGNEIVITNHQSIPSGASTAGVAAVCPPIQAIPNSANPITSPQNDPKLETKDMSGI